MIIITGGLGFIGLHTARAFLDAGEASSSPAIDRQPFPNFSRTRWESASSSNLWT